MNEKGTRSVHLLGSVIRPSAPLRTSPSSPVELLSVALRTFPSCHVSSRYALSLGVNLLGHNGNSQDGRMKVLIWFRSEFVSSGLRFSPPVGSPE